MMKHLLVARFSALGDVAMTVPVIAAVARQYPDLQITMVSRKHFGPLFETLPSNVHFIGVDLKKEYQGILGIKRLASDLDVKRFSAFADLHDVLRTKFLRLVCRLHGLRVEHLKKDRAARAALTREKDKKLVRQPSVFSKYADVFARLGYPITLTSDSFSMRNEVDSDPQFSMELPTKGDNRWVGIAPFAAHAGKVYPMEQMEKVVELLSAQTGVQTFLFGAGPKERAVLESWQERYPNTLSIAGRLKSMGEELQLMRHLDVMLSMDSANMHLASLVQTPVVSVWGATHPYAGFMGWNQNEDNALQINLPCRPCSIFGNIPCRRGDYACLTRITPQQVVDKLAQVAQFNLA